MMNYTLIVIGMLVLVVFISAGLYWLNEYINRDTELGSRAAEPTQQIPFFRPPTQ